MAYFIIYLIGCIVAFLVTGHYNDKFEKDDDKLNTYYILLSWVVLFIFSLFYIVDNLSYKPSHKDVKEFFNNLFKKKK